MKKHTFLRQPFVENNDMASLESKCRENTVLKN